MQLSSAMQLFTKLFTLLSHDTAYGMQAMIKSVGLLCALRLLPLAAAGWGDATLDLGVGPVKGNVWGDAEEFLAIPYASIPKRFDPSVPLDRLPGKQPFDATNILGHGECACAQAGPPYTPGPGKVYGVEHCLILTDLMRTASSGS